MDVRPATVDDVDRLARLWYDGWQDAHAAIVPPELKAARTLESFRERLAAALPHVRVLADAAHPANTAPLGFHWLEDDALYQFYVAAEARGTGAARTLIRDAESRLAERGVVVAWLSCAIGNHRAARFYEKSGWTRVGTMVDELTIPSGPFHLETWRYEKTLSHLKAPPAPPAGAALPGPSSPAAR